MLPCLLDIGEAMIVAGGDVNMVERLLRHVGYAYGAAKMNVLVITASIIITMTMPDGLEHTQTRRVEAAVETDFHKLEKLFRLCRTCTRAPLAPRILMERLRPLIANTIVFNFIASLVSGVLIAVASRLVLAMSPGMVTIGVIMLLIPGIPMTNAIRDMINGDTISGIMRFVESLLWATSLALGFMVAMWLFGISQPSVISNASPTVQIVSALPATLGFALFFNVRRQLLAPATLGGVLTEGLYLLLYLSGSWDGAFIPMLIAAGFAAVYAEVLSHYLTMPTSVFFIIAVIPLVPGRGLYYTMQSAVQQNWEACAQFGGNTVEFALGIAIGIIIVWSFVQTRRNVKAYRQRRSAPGA